MLTALDRGQPDRVPIYDWIDEPVILALAAPEEATATRKGDESAEVMDLYCRVIEALDLDASVLLYSTGLERTIDAAAPGGGYVLCSSNSLHPGCRPENALAMFRAARRYGDYGLIQRTAERRSRTPPPPDAAPPRPRRRNRRRRG